MTDTSIEPRCPICDGRSLRQPEHPKAALYRCVACTHCFTDPASIVVPEAYGPDYFIDAHRNWFNNPNIALFEIIRTHAGVHGTDVALLDVGCGKGDLLRHIQLAEPSWHLTGIDLSPNESCSGITFLQGDIFDMPGEQQYDVVTNLLVIEHIADVHGFVEALRSLCKPGGRLIITTNDENSILYAAARMLKRFGRRAAYDRLYSHHHLNHFSVTTLRQLLQRHSISVIHTIHHNIPMAAVDVPPAHRVTRAVWHAGVVGAFAAGTLSRRTFLQTVVCEVV